MIWHVILSAHWLLSGLANTAVLFVVARLVAFGYREHSYLYQFEDRAKAVDTWIEVILPYVRRLGLRRYRASVATKLARSGVRRGWDSSHFIASQVLLAGFTAVGSFVILSLLFGQPLYVSMTLTLLMAILPYLK